LPKGEIQQVNKRLRACGRGQQQASEKRERRKGFYIHSWLEELNRNYELRETTAHNGRRLRVAVCNTSCLGDETVNIR
jgi:hypothetical protein